METVKLVVQKRHQTGKGVARQLRRAGQLPAVLYGHGTAVAIALSEKDLVRIQQSEAGANTILDFAIEGDTPENCRAILREVQINPVSRAPLHADFYRVDMRQALTVAVHLEFINEPHNLLQSVNAVLTHLRREVEVACLPQNIPDALIVDLANIQPGDTFKAGALVLPPGVTLVLDAEEAIVTAHVEHVEAETTEEEAPSPEEEGA
jgi:large subunit ribosomal protein L25